MTIGTVEFGGGELGKAMASGSPFIPFVEKVGDEPQSLDELSAKYGLSPAPDTVFRTATMTSFRHLFDYLGSPDAVVGTPTLAQLAIEGDLSLGNLAGTGAQTVEHTQLELASLGTDGLVGSGETNGVTRFHLSADWTST